TFSQLPRTEFHTYRSPPIRYASPSAPDAGSSASESNDPLIVTPVPSSPGGPCSPALPVSRAGLEVAVVSSAYVMTVRNQMNSPSARVGVAVDQPDVGGTVSDAPTAYSTTLSRIVCASSALT